MDLDDYKYYLDVNGISRHLGTDYPYNENNAGFGITAERELDNNVIKRLTAGGYNNSFNNPSYYFGGGLAKRYSSGDFYADVGALGGLITGYDKTLSPMLTGSLSLGYKDRARLNMLLAPPTKKSPTLFMMNLGIPFK